MTVIYKHIRTKKLYTLVEVDGILASENIRTREVMPLNYITWKIKDFKQYIVLY